MADRAAGAELAPRLADGAEAAAKRRMAMLLEAQRRDLLKNGPPDLDRRRVSLDKLLRAILRHEGALVEAVSADFGHRSPVESRFTEIFVTVSALRHALRHVGDWMKPRRRPVGLAFQPARGEILCQPKGVIGVMSPWNYPVQLALCPMASILAAGNRALLKPSEFTPRTAEVLTRMIAESFDETELAVVTGGVEVGRAFSGLPFDHLLFTGAPSVGHHIMRAAADHLVPVTLELGGKSPCLIDRDFDFRRAMPSLVYGKLLNAGQTCIAPDYALVAEARLDDFVAAFTAEVKRQFPRLADNPDYTAIINDRNYKRLRSYIDDARAQGAQVTEINPGGETIEVQGRKLAPHVARGVTPVMKLATEEIFGPILPVHPYRTIDDAVDYINERPRPLALYLFSDDKAVRQQVLTRTTSGGVTINDTMIHVAQEELPFGGIGPAGMGAYHGEIGFRTFSHEKAVLTQARHNAVGLVRPPYGRTIKRLLDLMIGR